MVAVVDVVVELVLMIVGILVVVGVCSLVVVVDVVVELVLIDC